MDEVAPINVRLAALNITLASVLSRLWFRCWEPRLGSIDWYVLSAM
jgi:hypothetical protein